MTTIENISESLKVLSSMNMNIPMILVNNSTPKTDSERINNILSIKSLAERCKVPVVIPGIEKYKYLTLDEFWTAIKDYNGDAIIIFRAPRTPCLFTGLCQPGPWNNKISLDNSEFYKVIWSDSSPVQFPSIFHGAINDLNKTLYRGKETLDGMYIRFSFHTKVEGYPGDKIVLWGQNF